MSVQGGRSAVKAAVPDATLMKLQGGPDMSEMPQSPEEAPSTEVPEQSPAPEEAPVQDPGERKEVPAETPAEPQAPPADEG